MLAGAASYLLWGVAGTQFGSLLAYGLLFGAVAGGWTCVGDVQLSLIG